MRRGLGALACLVWVIGGSHGCVGDSNGPLGKGSVLTVDVDASSSGGPTDEADAAPGASDAPPYGAADAAAAVAYCAACACAAGSFCFAGPASSSPPPAAGCAGASGGVEGGAPGVGCNAMPPQCGPADCVCLLEALGLPRLQASGCYPACATAAPGSPPSDGGGSDAANDLGPVVYCP